MSEIKVKPARGSTSQPDHIFISIKGDAKTSMTVTWRTSVDVTSGYALVREDGKNDLMKYEATTGYFKSDIDESNMFWADMVNLKPGTKYFYT
ncbi:MAG: fibronectin type III domain-containing protein, partial [Clostridia bacterium]|nr:fibronectin type III domain-containing protein [Clostridia bacterium]